MIFIGKFPNSRADLLLQKQPGPGTNFVLFAQHFVENSISGL
jgi:hypothetical protein